MVASMAASQLAHAGHGSPYESHSGSAKRIQSRSAKQSQLRSAKRSHPGEAEEGNRRGMDASHDGERRAIASDADVVPRALRVTPWTGAIAVAITACRFFQVAGMLVGPTMNTPPNLLRLLGTG